MSMTSFCCFYYWLWTYVLPFSNGFIAGFEEVTVSWEVGRCIQNPGKTSNILDVLQGSESVPEVIENVNIIFISLKYCPTV